MKFEDNVITVAAMWGLIIITIIYCGSVIYFSYGYTNIVSEQVIDKWTVSPDGDGFVHYIEIRNYGKYILNADSFVYNKVELNKTYEIQINNITGSAKITNVTWR